VPEWEKLLGRSSAVGAVYDRDLGDLGTHPKILKYKNFGVRP